MFSLFMSLIKYVSKKIYTHRLKATVTKPWCFQHLDTFPVSGKRCPMANQAEPTDMCRKTIPKARPTAAKEGSISKTP